MKGKGINSVRAQSWPAIYDIFRGMILLDEANNTASGNVAQAIRKVC
jgi:hypothetical protein